MLEKQGTYLPVLDFGKVVAELCRRNIHVASDCTGVVFCSRKVQCYVYGFVVLLTGITAFSSVALCRPRRFTTTACLVSVHVGSG